MQEQRERTRKNATSVSTRRALRCAALGSWIAGCLLMATAGMADNVVSHVSGEVEIGRGEPPQWTPAREGESVEANGRVRTGANGRVEITMGAGTVRVHENSMLHLPPPENGTDRVGLDEGHSLFDVLRRDERRFEVHTPTVVVSVKGTRFGVDTTREVGEVAVYRGMVGVREAGAMDAIETLVREGFLASGGGGIPIELNVTPSGDPWAAWSDLRREVRGLRDKPTRMNDVDRAKASLHRATNVDVLKNAAERRPEIAERLRQIQKERMEVDGAPEDPRSKGSRLEGTNDPVPASPTMDDDPAIDDAKRPRMRMMKQRSATESMMKSMDARLAEAELDDLMDAQTMTGGSTFASGETRLLFENLEGMDPDNLTIVMKSVQDVEDSFQSLSTTWTTSDLLLELESALISNGMSTTDARTVITKLTSN